jgi:cytochrome c-type biogenesis protein CcmH
MKRFLWIAFFTGLFSMIWVGMVSAQPPTPSDDDVNQIAQQMYCPVCENTPLDVCPTQACAQWRALIREKLAAGWTEAQIKQYFVEQYGARVLAAPPREGWYMLIYILPPLLLLLGVYMVYRAFSSMRKPAAANIQAEAEAVPEANDEYLSRVEKELKNRK